ncbi:hypothetical protein D7Z26_10290 [Cohnella endophytica]|uniref:Uncharacterized protein n=1 Tax=Cohnella endophytica TaxID=2419778 RepID=A0A494XYH4_9BACL|nr:hypothetical protein D7Z26_10290 [Cohnella endophytica]
MITIIPCEFFMKSWTSDNTMFTLRAIRPSVRQELDVDSEMQLAVAGKRNQPDTSAPTKRIAPGDFVALSRWDVVNTGTLSEIISKIERVFHG